MARRARRLSGGTNSTSTLSSSSFCTWRPWRTTSTRQATWGVRGPGARGRVGAPGEWRGPPGRKCGCEGGAARSQRPACGRAVLSLPPSPSATAMGTTQCCTIESIILRRQPTSSCGAYSGEQGKRHEGGGGTPPQALHPAPARRAQEESRVQGAGHPRARGLRHEERRAAHLLGKDLQAAADHLRDLDRALVTYLATARDSRFVFTRPLSLGNPDLGYGTPKKNMHLKCKLQRPGESAPLAPFLPAAHLAHAAAEHARELCSEGLHEGGAAKQHVPGVGVRAQARGLARGTPSPSSGLPCTTPQKLLRAQQNEAPRQNCQEQLLRRAR